MLYDDVQVALLRSMLAFELMFIHFSWKVYIKHDRAHYSYSILGGSFVSSLVPI